MFARVLSATSVLLLAVGIGTISSRAADPLADPAVSSVETVPLSDGSISVTVHLRDASGRPTAAISQPWLVIKAVRPPYSGSLGVYTTGPSQQDSITLSSGGRLGSDHGGGVVWVAPTAPDVIAVVTPLAPGVPSVVGWIVNDAGQGLPIGLRAAPATPTAAPLVSSVTQVAPTVIVAAVPEGTPSPQPSSEIPAWTIGALLLGAVGVAYAATRVRTGAIVRLPDPAGALLDVGSGTAVITHADGSSETASSSTLVRAGDRVVTDSATGALLRYPDGTVLELDPGTTVDFVQLQFDAVSGLLTEIAHSAGLLTANVKPLLSPDAGFNVRTPALWVGVRGTRFVVEVMPDGATRVLTLEGRVSVRAAGLERTINAGEHIIVEAESHSSQAQLGAQP